MQRALTIGYDATPAVRQKAGIGRYARELLKGLASLEIEDHYRLVYSAGHDSETDQAASGCLFRSLGPRFTPARLPASDRVMNAIWQRLRLPIPIELRTGRLDMMHSPDFSLPPSLAPGIVTIHDLAFEVVPDCSFPTLRTYLKTVVPRVVKRAAAVIADSQATKRDLEERYGVATDKIRVIAAGVGPPFRRLSPDALAAAVGRDVVEGPFILAVGTLEPRKNYERLLTAFAAIRARGRPHKLVIVGRYGWLYDTIFERYRQLDLGDSVKFLVDVSDDRLVTLYNMADITVYPSLYEGFGIPALEALACGCPLACSKTPALPEVVGDAAVTFDPYNVEDIVETVDALLLDDGRRRDLAHRGPTRASLFSWLRTATEAHRLYQQVARA